MTEGARCHRHGLAAGPSGLCAVCQRELRNAGEGARVRRDDRVPRLIAKVLLGVAAGLATFFFLLAMLDTDEQAPEPETERAPDAARG